MCLRSWILRAATAWVRWFAGAEQVLITCAVLSDIPEELGDYRLVSVTAGHAEYVHLHPATDSVTDSAGRSSSTDSALAEGDGDE